MFASASHLQRAGVSTSHQPLLRAALLGRSTSAPTPRQNTLLTNARHQSTTPDSPAASSSSNTSKDGKTTVNPMSWKLRKRLRRLSVKLEQTSGVAEKGADESNDSKWHHPTRPTKDVEDLKRRARKRWSEQAGQAAKAAALAAERERLRKNSAISRAERNHQRNEMREQAKEKHNKQEERDDETKNQESQGSASRGLEIGGSKQGSSAALQAEIALNWSRILSSIENNVKEEGPPESPETEVRDSPPHAKIVHRKMEQARDDPPRRRGRNGNENWQDQVIRGQDGNHGEEKKTELVSGPSITPYRRVRPASSFENIEQVSSFQYLPIDLVPKLSDIKRKWWDEEGKWTWAVGGRLGADEVKVEKVEPLREMQVPRLAHGLDRVLFNPGIHWLRDVRTGIYNFEPKIRNIYDVDLFDYSALPPYRTSSKDPELAELVRKLSKKYSGSTSSMTSLLSHIYFLISAWKQPDLNGFSSGFSTLPRSFSFGAKLPASIILRRFEEEYEGKMLVRYAIDADKGEDGAVDNSNYVLMQLGKSVEKLLTASPEEYQKYLRVNSHVLKKEEKEKPEAYHYAASEKLVMRSQLDCSDDRLPRKSFDLKTRSVVAVRQDRANWVESSGYMIRHANGVFESFEREMWDLTRATMLKYFFQARIGNMDGILIAYHSTATIFGFQYLSCEDMAMRLFSNVEMGEQAFKLSIGLLERILDTVTDIKPDHSLRITLDTELGENPKMFAFAQYIGEGVEVEEKSVVEEETREEKKSQSEEEASQEASQEEAPQLEATAKESRETAKESRVSSPSLMDEELAIRDKRLLQLDVQVDRYLGEDLVLGPVDFNAPNGYRIFESMEDEISRRNRAELPPLNWSIEYSITPRSDYNFPTTQENLRKILSRQDSIASLILPNLEALNEREKMRERELSVNAAALQKFYEDRKSGVAIGMPMVPGQVEFAGKSGEGNGDKEGMSGANPKIKEVNEEQEAQDPVQRWRKKSMGVERLRELARLGQEDKDREALTDKFELYERRGD